MARRKEVENAKKIGVVLSQEDIKKLDKLSFSTGLSRSKLIRAATKMFINLSRRRGLTKDKRSEIMKVLDEYYSDKGIEYDEAEIKKLINKAFLKIKEDIIWTAIMEAEGALVIDFICLDEEYNMVAKHNEFSEEDVKILKKVIHKERMLKDRNKK